jgi:hypothetical protein
MSWAMSGLQQTTMSEQPHDELDISQLILGASFWGRSAADRAANFIGASAGKNLLN